MEKNVYVFLADGFEEIEALAPVDILRRAGLNVLTVAMGEDLTVYGAHDVTVVADTLFSLNDFDDASALLLPGGMPGAANLAAHEGLCSLLTKKAVEEDVVLAAICAAPFVLGELGILKGHKATCYPGFEEHLLGADVDGQSLVVRSGDDLITACGPAAACELGFALVERLKDKATADAIREGMMFGRA